LILLNIEANGISNAELMPIGLDTEAGWSYFSPHLGSNGGLREGGTAAIRDGCGVVIATFRLDALLQERVDFIKMDVEGRRDASFEVLCD
jgi:hypothetical protein